MSERLMLWHRSTLRPLQLPVDIEEIVEVVEQISVSYITEQDCLDDNVLGAYDFRDDRLLVRDSFDNVGRQRFTWAHEYGHFVLHRPHYLQGVFDFDDESSQGLRVYRGVIDRRDMLEVQANIFAAQILMPKSLVFELFKEERHLLSGDQMVARLATEAAVSKMAARIRLQDLKILTEI
ncbi:MAG: ImmA/IrrE family metallo-endopeptidase [Armatimonadetes bacterium]|nr:ImmA/IrrE family metallo-endopeptidase [Armatimonadota bacterium]